MLYGPPAHWPAPEPAMTRRISLSAALAVTALACTFGLAAPAAAKVTKLEITSKDDFGTFKPGEYVWWQGKIYGEPSPSEKIPDLDKAARNARGMVEYSAKISLMFPKNPKSGNGTLLVDIPNRGRVYAQALYNSLHDEPSEYGTTEFGTGFLQDHGFAIAEVMWELGQGADLPNFTDGAGKKHFVEGVGFAIVRAAPDFLRNASADSLGTPNPLRGAVKHVLASGKSQSGRYLKTFLHNGFNMVDRS